MGLLLEVSEQGVDGELEHVINHAGEELFEQLRGLFDAWICVYLNEPYVHILVNNEVVAKQLKAVLPLGRVDGLFNCQKRSHNQLFYLKDNLL